MKKISIVLSGEEELSSLVDEIDDLVYRLRLKLGELRQQTISFEMMINTPPSTAVDSEEITDKI